MGCSVNGNEQQQRKLSRIMIQFGTKAQTLELISQYFANFFIPEFEYFKYSSWQLNKTKIIDNLMSKFNGCSLAVGSSSVNEDSLSNSMAGAFTSKLNVASNRESLERAVNEVFRSYGETLTPEDQVIVQKMVENVAISGVAMTRNLQDGAPYYTVSYDDLTGRTDTVTSGGHSHKTIMLHRLCPDVMINSPRVRAVLRLIRDIESVVGLTIPVDIEFAVDKDFTPHLLQVRPITNIDAWDKNIETLVNTAIENARESLKLLEQVDVQLLGTKTIYANMPDWNPAEIIGDIPRPLAATLYRNLITRSTWSKARAEMGYKSVESAELMKIVAGHAYIDVRASLNSLLPENLDDALGKMFVDKGISRLCDNPDFHDKLEFELAITVHTPNFDEDFERIFSNLGHKEKDTFEAHLKRLTNKIVSISEESSLASAENKIRELEKLQKLRHLIIDHNLSEHQILTYVSLLQTECIKLGTVPFAILARHGFVAQTLLKSFVLQGILSMDRCEELKASIETVAGELSKMMEEVNNETLSIETFFQKFGHLRPGSYDILSARYCDRKSLFKSADKEKTYSKRREPFEFSDSEAAAVENGLRKSGITSLTADEFYEYVYRSTSGREWSKLIFTRHLSDIIELISVFGEKRNLSREDLSFMNFESVLDLSFDRGSESVETMMMQRIEAARRKWKTHSSIFLPHLISSSEDLSIIPLQKGTPNFITQLAVEGEIIVINANDIEHVNLEGKVICIESADPGFDWIFSRKIIGLVTQHGGPNSHMAIRCTEFGLPAAIGVGKELFKRLKTGHKIWFDCAKKSIELTPC